MTPEEELALIAQEQGDAKRTLICEPERAEEVRAAVARMGRSHLYTVSASPACPAGKILILDDQALQASMNQTFLRAAKNIRLHP